MFLSAPGRTGRIPSGKGYVFQVSPFWTEYHHAVGFKHSDPEVSIRADEDISMVEIYTGVN